MNAAPSAPAEPARASTIEFESVATQTFNDGGPRQEACFSTLPTQNYWHAAVQRWFTLASHNRSAFQSNCGRNTLGVAFRTSWLTATKAFLFTK